MSGNDNDLEKKSKDKIKEMVAYTFRSFSTQVVHIDTLEAKKTPTKIIRRQRDSNKKKKNSSYYLLGLLFIKATIS